MYEKELKMKIRKAKLNEARKIYLGILKKPNRESYNEQLVKDLIKDKLSICLVAERESKIIGTLGARREGYKGYWLYFLHPKKKDDKEVEFKLMKEFFKYAKKLGANKIASDTPEIKLLKKFGFNEVGRIPRWQANGKDQIIMFKKLK